MKGAALLYVYQSLRLRERLTNRQHDNGAVSSDPCASGAISPALAH